MKNKKTFISISALLIILALGYFLFTDNNNKNNYISYPEFYSEVENQNIASVTIKEKNLQFTRKDGDKLYFTDNPDSSVLKEFLLRNGAEVKVEKNTEEIISVVFDIIFYLFFFGIIFIAFRKFISPNTFKVIRKTGVKFENIVGMENLKKDMKQIMEIMHNPTEYAKKGIRMPKGILLEGDPGNGKTLFARALAGEASVNFIPAKATDFESMFMAIGPMKVKLLFKKARRKAPCIIFIDEFDGIGTRRNYSGSAIETENTRIVTALLNELDGFQPTQGILVLAATNSIQALDEALIRPGRFDAKFKVPYPDSTSREELIKMYTKGKQLSEECSVSLLSKLFTNFSCAKIESVINRAAMISSQQNTETITLDFIKQAIAEN